MNGLTENTLAHHMELVQSQPKRHAIRLPLLCFYFYYPRKRQISVERQQQNQAYEVLLWYFVQIFARSKITGKPL